MYSMGIWTCCIALSRLSVSSCTLWNISVILSRASNIACGFFKIALLSTQFLTHGKASTRLLITAYQVQLLTSKSLNTSSTEIQSGGEKVGWLKSLQMLYRELKPATGDPIKRFLHSRYTLTDRPGFLTERRKFSETLYPNFFATVLF